MYHQLFKALAEAKSTQVDIMYSSYHTTVLELQFILVSLPKTI